MAIIALRAWYLEKYEPLETLKERPHDLRLSKNSLLKMGLRADFLEEREQIERATWFQRYLTGETIEFYIEGSGSYAISNIDLSSHEIYFTKFDGLAHLDPLIYLCHQTHFEASSQALGENLDEFARTFNRSARLPVRVVQANRSEEYALRLNRRTLDDIRKSLLFVADITPLGVVGGDPPQLLPSPNVCVEIGYAIQCKRPEQIVLAYMRRPNFSGQFPFDLPTYQQLEFENSGALPRLLPPAIEAMLQRFNLKG
ncbi:MAG: hypothetical protein ACFB9N_16510 [Geitlerinemataceae cyanobacterium]